MGRRPERTFSQGYTDGQQAYGKMLGTVSHREMQIKTTIRYHLTLVRMTVMKKSPNNQCRQGYGEKQTLIQCWWQYKSGLQVWKQY